MSQPSLKEKTAKGLLWGGIGNGALQLLNLAFGIFLSRLLTPADYGMVGALTIFSALAGIFAESGFILAIVNKKEVRHEDYNAVFWFNITVGGTLYLLLFACAPLIARFYHTPELAPLARFLFLSFLVGSTTAAPLAYYFRNLMVKERSQIQITAIIVSGIVGVTCAYRGWGSWGIAVQTVVYSGMNALLIWLRSPWRPTFSFNRKALLDMLPVGKREEFAHRTLAGLEGRSDYEEMRDTFLGWCESPFASGEVAERLSMHRNSLQYRLKKIRALTGKDPWNFKDAFELWAAFVLKNISEEEKS